MLYLLLWIWQIGYFHHFCKNNTNVVSSKSAFFTFGSKHPLKTIIFCNNLISYLLTPQWDELLMQLAAFSFMFVYPVMWPGFIMLWIPKHKTTFQKQIHKCAHAYLFELWGGCRFGSADLMQFWQVRLKD